MTVHDAVAGTAATVTSQGLKCTAVLDDGDYPEGAKISDDRMQDLHDRVLVRHGPHRDRNYTILPVPRPAPVPEPGPEPPGRCPAAMLNQPALTGMDPADLEAMAAAIKIPFGARREHDLSVHRGGRRSRRGRRPPPKITIMDHVLALRLRDHLNLPVSLTGTMLGVDRTTISHAVSLARQLIAGNGIPLPAAAPPPGTRLRTPAELLQYAEAAGIDLTIPQIRPCTPKYSRRRRAEPRDAPETAN